MVDKIAVEIDLEGGDQVEKQLADIGKAGTKAFSDIDKAAQQLDPSDLTDKFKDLGSSGKDAVTGIDDAVKGFPGYDKLDPSDLTQKLEALQKTVGTAVNWESLVQGAKSLENALGSVGNAVEHVSSHLTRHLGIVGAAARSFGPLGIAVGVTVFAMEKFIGAAEATAAAIEKLSETTGQSFENVSRMQQVFAQGGTSAKDFGQFFGNLAEQVAKARAELSNAPQGAKDWANNLDNVTNQFRNIAKGIPEIIDPLTTIDTQVKALKQSLASVQTPGIGFQPIIKQADDLQKTLADTFKNLPVDQARRLQTALQIPDSVFDTLRKGSAELKNLGDQADKTGLELDKTDEQALKRWSDATNKSTAMVQAGGQKLGALFVKAFEDAVDSIQQKGILGGLGEIFSRALQGLGAGFGGGKLVEDISTIIAWLGRAKDAVLEFAGSLGGIVWDAITSGAANAWNTVIGAIQSAISWVQQFAGSLTGIVWDAITSGAQSAWNTVVGAIQNAINWVQQFAGSLAGIAWDALTSAGQAAWTALLSWATSAWAQFKAALGIGGGAGNGGGEGGGIQAASGGLIGGRGTGTSDSNIAWVSRGEHIMPARAVAQPGVLALLEALRSSGGNLRAVLDGIGRFALGGVVPSIPALAAGGMNHVTIAFPGLAPISGLRASSAVVDELRRSAAMAQVRSGGRKPSRYS